MGRGSEGSSGSCGVGIGIADVNAREKRVIRNREFRDGIVRINLKRGGCER